MSEELSKTIKWKIDRATVDIPIQIDIPSFDNTAKSPTWKNFDSNKMSHNNPASQTAKGEYSCIFTLGKNYRWPDKTIDPKEVKWRIKTPPEISIVPTVDTMYTYRYDGTEKTPRWKDLDLDQLDLSGDIAATVPGNYTVTMTPKQGFHWSDGSTSPKDVTWVLNKGYYTVDVYPSTSMSMSRNGGCSVVVNTSHYYTISESWGITTSKSGNTIQIRGGGSAGNYTVSLNFAESTYYQSMTVTIYVKAT